jgi:hypothetical protein
MNRRQFALLAAAGSATALVGGAGAMAAASAPPATYHGLVLVPSKKLKAVYLKPGADFRTYTQVMVDPTQISFDQNWIQQYNESMMAPSDWIDPSDVKSAASQAAKKATSIFEQTFAAGGYPIATAPAPNVLRVLTALADIIVAAPDMMSAMGRTYSTSEAAGSAKLILEARDSVSGELLGLAVDARLAGNDGMLNRSSVTNWADFSQLATKWAQIAVGGLNELKTLSPLKAGSASAATP